VQPPILIAAATRPYPGERANGDAWRVDWHGSACRIAVIDGVGHGPEAAAAAALAVDALAAHPALGPEESLRLCHGALVGSRGAAISIAHLDPVAGQLSFAGIGNVDAILRTLDGERHLVTYPGIIGVVSRTVRRFDLSLGERWLLLMHTDGVRSRLRIDALIGEGHATLDALAEAILAGGARPTDDATVVVAMQGATIV